MSRDVGVGGWAGRRLVVADAHEIGQQLSLDERGTERDRNIITVGAYMRDRPRSLRKRFARSVKRFLRFCAPTKRFKSNDTAEIFQDGPGVELNPAKRSINHDLTGSVGRFPWPFEPMSWNLSEQGAKRDLISARPPHKGFGREMDTTRHRFAVAPMMEGADGAVFSIAYEARVTLGTH